MTQAELLNKFGVSTFNMTERRISEVVQTLDSFIRNRTPANTVRRHLKHMGLSADDVEHVLYRLRRGGA